MKQVSGKKVRKLIRKECDKVAELLIRKNREYGNSAICPMRVFSDADAVEQILVRCDDKLNRILTTRKLSKKGKKLEVKEDTFNDLMGYLVLLAVAKKLRKRGLI